MISARLSQRQAAFRADFRARISSVYRGSVHVALIYALGLATIAYSLGHVAHVAWFDWLTIPVALCLANGFEWAVHRFVMHRPVPGLMGIYKRHTLAHHQFFTDHEPTIDGVRDFRIVFFPPSALVAFIAMSAVPAWLFVRAGLPNVGWLLLASHIGLYLNYELFHLCCHVKNDRWIRHIPFVNTIRRHHIAHHDTSIMMERNFNLTYPMADWLFGTSDLRRGLLGHLFNGYSTRHRAVGLRRVRYGVDDVGAGQVART